MKDDRVYLTHIIQGLQRLISYTESMSLEYFLSDVKTQDACIRQLEVIGEATKRISISLRDRFPKIAWRGMAGMRDRLIHEYMDIDLSIVWSTATNDAMPTLIDLEEIYVQLQDEASSETTN